MPRLAVTGTGAGCFPLLRRVAVVGTGPRRFRSDPAAPSRWAIPLAIWDARAYLATNPDIVKAKSGLAPKGAGAKCLCAFVG